MSPPHNHAPRRGRGDVTHRTVRENRNNTHNQYEESGGSLVPPPPPSINSARRDRSATAQRPHADTNSKARASARTPPLPARFEDHRRSYDISNSARGGGQRRNGSSSNTTNEEGRDLQRNVHRTSDNNIPSKSTSSKSNQGYEDEDRHRNQENRKYPSGKNHYSPPSHPPSNPLPSTSYATNQSNGDTEYNRMKISRRNMSPSSVSKMVSPYPVSHSKSQEVRSNKRKEYYKYSNSPTRDSYRSAEKNSRFQENNSSLNRSRRSQEKDNHSRRLSQKSAMDVDKIISANEFQGNIDKNNGSKSKNTRSNSFDRDRSPINIRPDKYRAQSSERGNNSISKNDTKENSESTIEGERRQPLMSQREAFHRQQSKRHSNDDNHFSLKKSNEIYFQNKHIPDDEGSIAYSRRISSENQTSISTTNMSNHNSFHLNVEKESSTIKQSSKTGYSHSRSPRQAEKEKSKYIQNTNTEKVEKNTRDKKREIHDVKEIEKEKFLVKYNANDIGRQRTHDHDTEQSDLVTKHKYEHKSEKYYSEDAGKNRKRPLSPDREEQNQPNKKGKHHSGYHAKGRKSSKTAHYGKSISSDKITENNTSKDSDLDSASSETKRVSALSRLGPKITLNERLSKLSESEDDSTKQPKLNSTPFQSKDDVPKNSRLSMIDEQSQQYDDSFNRSTKETHSTSRGMQITIHKGPNDQTKRFVNSDITHLKCERVIFGDKKYIDLLCPHCKTTSVTFNEYGSHFQNDVHIQAMKKVKQRLQKELQSLRKQQRELQKAIDSTASENEGDAKKEEKSGYCKICKLIFKHRSKAEHDKTEFHKKVVSFLYPECTFCKIPKFFSPMAYEKHIATLGHIKKRNKIEQSKSEVLDKQTDLRIDFEEIEEENNQIFGEFDPEEFEILDEVGEDDEMLEEMTHNRKSDEQSSDMNQDYPTLLRTPVNFSDINKSTIDGTTAEATNKSIIKGETFVRKVVMLFCDLCHKYLPRIDLDKDIQSLLEEHCLSAGHLNAYDKNEKNQLDDTSKKSTETENNQKPVQDQPYSADEEQLDFEAEDSVGAADTSPIVKETSIA